jgi:hypothetical protein
MSVFMDMEAALQSKLDSITGHPKIHWENDDVYTPVYETRFWRPTNLPIRSELATAGALQKHQGIYQIDVFVEPEQGVAQLMTDLDLIYEAFNTTESLVMNATKVNILSVGRGRVDREEAWCKGFIEIYYMCYSH